MAKDFLFFSSTKRVIAKNITSQLVGRIIGAVTTLIVTVIIARQFGADGFGDFVKVTTYVAFFYLIVDFGINAIFIQKDAQDYWPALIAIRILGGALLMIISLGILAMIPGSQENGYTPGVRLGILLFSPTILLQGLITTANAVFQKHLRYDRAAWAIFWGSIVTIIALGVILYGIRSTNLLLVIGAVGIGTLVSTLASLYLASRVMGRVLFVPTVDQLQRLIVPSIPLGITLLFNLVYFRADSVIITLSRPTSEVGIYGLAYKAFEVILVFPTFYMNAVYPLMIQEVKNNRLDALKKIIRNSILFLLIASFFFFALIWYVAPLLVLIKSEFALSVEALRILASGLPFFFVTSVIMWGIIALKKQILLAFIYGATMAINIAGNILLVPTHGFIAAAWMTVVGEGLILLVSGLTLLHIVRKVAKQSA